MASSSRNPLPLLSSPSLPRSWLHRHHAHILSSSSYCPIRHSSSAVQRRRKLLLRDVLDNIPAQKSRKVEMKKMTGSMIPDDLGLLPGTLFRPPNQSLPRLFGSEWKSRLKWEWMWTLSRVQYFASLTFTGLWIQRKMPKSQRALLNLQSRPAIALDLHYRFYDALASGNLAPVRNLLCTGLASQARTQVIRRREQKNHQINNNNNISNSTSNSPSPSPSQTPTEPPSPHPWRLIRYTSPIRAPFFLRFFPWPLTSLLPGTQAKIVSDRFAGLPVGKDAYLRQCIVRIRSLQELQPDSATSDGGGSGDNSPSTTETRRADLTEYVVMQQLKADGQPPHWKLWGTVDPLSKQQVLDLVKRREDGAGQALSTTLWDRLKANFPLSGL